MTGNINMTREQRAALLDRIDVLNKVKALMLLPGLCMVTMKQAAAYFEVSLDCVQKCYSRNRAELNANGAVMLTPTQLLEQLNGQDVQLVKPIDTLSFPVPGDAECASLKVMWNSY